VAERFITRPTRANPPRQGAAWSPSG